VFAERAVREAGNADGGTAVSSRLARSPQKVSLMTLFAVSFGGQGQPFDCEVVKDALILGIRHALRPRETHVGLGSELLRLRRKLQHLTAPSADT
jgi:hypothetical protein